MPDNQQNAGAGKHNLGRLAKLNCFARSVYEANPSNTTINIMDISNPEVLEFLTSLHKNKVKYMLVGGVATVFHGHIRTTQDLDLWIKETPGNKKRLVKALEALKVPGASNYENIEMVPGWSTITIGEHGFEADLMGYMNAFKKEDFDRCFQRARKGTFQGVPITVIHVNDLIRSKKATGRAKDIEDVENLEKIKKRKSGRDQC